MSDRINPANGHDEPDHDETDHDETDYDETDHDDTSHDETDLTSVDPDIVDDPDGTDSGADTSATTDPGAVLFSEPGGSWWVVAIGPVLVVAILILEGVGPGSVHWGSMVILGLIITGFSVLQVYAARKHVSMELTETTLRQGTRVIGLDQIATIFPENTGSDHRDWESAPALGELHGVPRRRKGIGVKLTGGSLAQAWARDVARFRRELTEAHMAVQMGLGPHRPTD